MTISFHVSGIPGTKGSTKGFIGRSKKTGKPRVFMVNMSDKAKPWAARVKAAAFEAMKGRTPLCGPVCVSLTFYLQRPRRHYRMGKFKHILKPNAPQFCDGSPDLDKLERCLWDALSHTVLFDDRIVVQSSAVKYYANAETGCDIEVESL